MTLQEMDIILLENNKNYIVIKSFPDYSDYCFYVVNTSDINDKKFITIENGSIVEIKNKEVLDRLNNDMIMNNEDIKNTINNMIDLIDDTSNNL